MWSCIKKTAVTVVLASQGYPESYETGMRVRGLDKYDKFQLGLCY